MSEPRSPPTSPSHLSKAKTPLQTGAANSTGLLLRAGGLSSGRSRMSAFHPAPSYLSLRLSSRWVLSWGGFCPAPTTGMQSLLLRMCWGLIIYMASSMKKRGVQMLQKRQAKNTQGTASSPPSTEKPIPEYQTELCHWPHPQGPQLKYSWAWETQ